MTSKLIAGLNLAKIGVFLALEAPVRPRWAYYRLRGYAYSYVLNRFHQEAVGQYAGHVRPFHDAVGYVLGLDRSAVLEEDDSELIRSMVVQNRWVVSLGGYGKDPNEEGGEGPIEVRYGPSPEMMRLINLVCRLVRPDLVVEAGVGRGFTTAATLEAMDRNGTGRLISVELPSLYVGFRKQVGEIIPERLRSRWSLRFGPSALVLPEIGGDVGRIDVFIHDSGANYDTQMTEFGIALRHMRPGGVLISNMLNSDAFLETASSVPCRWAVVEQSKKDPLGLLQLTE